MDSLSNPWGRRKFLKKGIASGAMIAAFPLWGSTHLSAPKYGKISPSHDYSRDESHRRLLKIMRTYGGEFGDTRGGL
jgi:hypothetical protein